MPSWTGWNEDQVRVSPPKMAGFTPINSANGPSQPPAPTRQTDSRQSAPSAAKAASQAVADYLGRGENSLTGPDPPQPKKGTTTRKKRASVAGEEPKKKRRKSSNISDGMPVTKLASKEQAELARGKSKKKGASAQAQTTSETILAPLVSMDAVGDASTATNPISVYGHSTSMDALDSTSVHTTYDFVKAGDGRGYTLYQSQPPSMQANGTVEFSQPWLNTAVSHSADIHQQTEENLFRRAVSKDGASRTERPSRKAKAVASEKNSKLFRQHEDQATAPVSHSQSTKTTAKRRSRSSQNAAQNDSNQKLQPPVVIDLEDEFSDVDEEALVDIVTAVEENVGSRQETPPARKWKQNMREVDEDEDYGGALLSRADRLLLDKFKEKSRNAVKPVVRKPFQRAILDRSAIFGASNSMSLRTCFRLGEALNTGSQAVRCNNNCIIELYARVTSSWRDPKPGRKQHFVFKDLYHDKPPFLDGTFELWDQAQLWDLDSKVFLKASHSGIMCRAVARMKRDGQKWRLEILSVWEATWEDVNYAAGIYSDDVKTDGVESEDD